MVAQIGGAFVAALILRATLPKGVPNIDPGLTTLAPGVSSAPDWRSSSC